MKLTWFGATTIRVHIGGSVLVVDAAGTSPEIDRAELVSGADRVIERFGAELDMVDLGRWTPRRPARLLDEGDALPQVMAWSASRDAILIDAEGEPPLLLLAAEAPALGRWADGAVVVLFGDGAQLVSAGGAVLAQRAPKLLALAAGEAAIDAAIPVLGGALDGTALLSLEPCMALEA